MRIRRRHLAFRLGDIRPALEQIGRQPRIQSGRLAGKLLRSHMETRGRLTGKHCNRVLKLVALFAQQCGLRLRSAQQRLFLRHVQSRRNSALVARRHELQAFIQGGHGAVEDRELAIELAQREIVARHLGGDYEAHVF